MGETHWAILKLIERHPTVKLVYFETHTVRYPHKDEPTEKIETARRLIVQ